MNRDESRAFRKLLEENVRKLSHDEAEVLELHYGLFGSRLRTPEEVAETLGKSVEEVEQLEEKALWKLRHTHVL